MKVLKSLFIILLLIISKLSAQNRAVDSLVELMATSAYDTSKINLYIKLCEACDLNDNLKYAEPGIKLTDDLLAKAPNEKVKRMLLRQKARFYNFCFFYYQEKADSSNQRRAAFNELEIFRTLQDTENIFNKLLGVAQSFFNYGNTFQALIYYEKAVDFARKNNNKKLVSYAHFQMGTMFEISEDYKNAIAYYEKARQTQAELHDSILTAWCMRKIGVCWYLQRDLKNALRFLTNAIGLYGRDEKGVLACTQEIADAYKFNNDYADAILYYKKGLAMTKKIPGFDAGQFRFLNRIGNTFRDAKNYDSARVYIQLGLNLAIGLKDARGIMISNFSLAKLYFQQNKYAEAKKYFSEKNYLQAQEAYGMGRDMINIEQWAFKIDSALGNSKEALVHYMRYIQFYNKFNNEDLSKQAAKEKFQEQYNKQAAEQALKDDIAQRDKKKQQIVISAISVGLFLVLLLALVIFRNLRINQRNNKIISEQKHLVEEKNHEITDSINYAQRIQSSLLPPLEDIEHALPDSFVLFKPKDIVSGDFFWFAERHNKIFIAAADCTGHGVPGAFMSMLNSDKLNQAIEEHDSPGPILQHVNRGVKKALRQSDKEGSSRDGMDIALLCLNKERTKLIYAGANRPLWIIRNNTVIIEETKATKTAIGGLTEDDQKFTEHTFDLQKGDTVYIFSDGYADQFSPDDKKLMTRNFKEKLLHANTMSMPEQKQFLDNYIKSWKGTMEQTDDILVIGIRV